jgi:hypothetical protein
MPDNGVSKSQIDHYLTNFMLRSEVINELKTVDLLPALCVRAYERDHEIRTLPHHSHGKTLICFLKQEFCFEVLNSNYLKPGVGLPCDMVNLLTERRRKKEEGESRLVQKEHRGGG